MEKSTEMTGVDTAILRAILNAAQDGAAPCVQYSKDNAVFAQRAAALSIKKCEQIEEMVKSVLLGDPVVLPQADTADGEELVVEQKREESKVGDFKVVTRSAGSYVFRDDVGEHGRYLQPNGQWEPNAHWWVTRIEAIKAAEKAWADPS